MTISVAELRAAFDRTWSTPDMLRVLPGLDEQRNPEGCVVGDGRNSGWQVYVEDRGRQHLGEFSTKEAALQYAWDRWILWNEDA